LHRIDLVLIEAFPIHSLTAITEPLRIANRESLEKIFTWRLLSPDGDVVRSSSGIPLSMDCGLDDEKADAVIVLSSYQTEEAMEPPLLTWLRRRAHRGDLMGCVDTAALLFAKAGLLVNRPAAVHYEAVQSFRDQFSPHMFTDRIYDFSPPLCSSSGGVGTINMTLALIEHFANRELARRAASILNYVPYDRGKTQTIFDDAYATAQVNRDLARCTEIMHNNIDLPLTVAEIASRVGLPHWRMRRLFLKYLERTPSDYYLSLRLAQGRNLLRNSHFPVGDIAGRCGFDNHETFSRASKRRYGLPPSRDRGWRM